MKLNPAEPIRVVYFGTPEYAIPALEALLSDPRAIVPLVVTQPDRPAGRGRKLAAPPVKQVALGHRLAVYQPESLRTEADRGPIEEIGADLFVVAAYGKIFGPKLLALPRLGSVNLHASLLPLYRGASPISAAILVGREETGVTLMRMDAGLDTGPAVARRSLRISPDATTASLTPQLAQLGAELLIESIDGLIDGSLVPVAQDEHEATVTRPLLKADGWIDWAKPAVDIERQIRAMWDWPRGWTTLRGAPVQVHLAAVDPTDPGSAPGTVETLQGRPAVTTGDGRLLLEVAQSPGSKPLNGAAWLQQSGATGAILGKSGAPESPERPMIRRVLS
jgi:methionyl-tRNA formyltransferase